MGVFHVETDAVIAHEENVFVGRFGAGNFNLRLLAGAGDGLMPWRGRPEPLKRGLIARVPPLGFVEKDFQENFQETIG